jgi:crotonobetainyl-CoA:carnitine CoA-transferase CaiB-like acyl-CoA transferase
MFESLTIIDCSTVLAGPSVGTFFAELGAKVLKIENPEVPDVTRSWKLPDEDKNSSISAYFSSVNYKKQYEKLNFKLQTDREQLLGLIAHADIFLSNFKKGDAEKFGITDETLQKINPKLIIGKISGFGSASDRVAYDLILQAETGFMSMNGTPTSGPVKMPVALIDVLAAHHLKEGLLTALLNRHVTGKGAVVSVSLYDAAVSSLANQASNYLMQNHIPKRIGSLHPNIAPYGEIFTTAEGELITLAIGSNKHFSLLCQFLGLENLLSDLKFSENASRVANRVELFETLQERIGQQQTAQLMDAMNKNYVPIGKIKNLAEVFSDSKTAKLIRDEQMEGKETKRVSQIAFTIQ